MGTRKSEVELDIAFLEPSGKGGLTVEVRDECDKEPGVLGCASSLASECNKELGVLGCASSSAFKCDKEPGVLCCASSSAFAVSYTHLRAHETRRHL
eukprot:7501865-Prorocentrum_lima.AAC.1